MKVLLTAINAKYIHTNLAIYCLKAYAKEYKEQIKLSEYTINHHTDDILQGIYKEKPDIIGFSCYIWNIAMINELCVELRKVLPHTKIWLGGPEVSFDVEKRLRENAHIDGILIGEGEISFKELLDYYIGEKRNLYDVKGIAFKNSALLDGDIPLKEEIIITSFRPEMNLSDLPFPYENIEEFKNKIIYYETSRGCPYSCRYCLSSVDKRVRFRDISLVEKELDIFLSHKVPQVKFVDRTFNCNRAHTKAIWQYIKDHDNGVTNFHFEISADILNEEEITLLNSMREGLVQLEIGVQSTNPETLKAIERNVDFEHLSKIVKAIYKGRNVHQHLDLIAGLPYEDYDSFKRSFNDVYGLRPDQLQLGFLKVLKGSGMFYDSPVMGIVYKEQAPFEVLYTKWLSYDDVLKLKQVEDMVEVYYNSGQFVYSIQYLEHFYRTPFDFYEALGAYYERKGFFLINHSRMHRYEILLDFLREQQEQWRNHGNDNTLCFEDFDEKTLIDIMVLDLYSRENLKSPPAFASNQEIYKDACREFYCSEELVRKYIGEEYIGEKLTQLKRYTHLEHFDIQVIDSARLGKTIKGSQFILFDYIHRNKLNGDARCIIIKEMDK